MGTIDYVNKRVIEKTGYRNNELVGQNFLMLQSEKTSISLYKSIWEQLNRGKNGKENCQLKIKMVNTSGYQQLFHHYVMKIIKRSFNI